jgi:spore maturation protein CgeB
MRILYTHKPVKITKEDRVKFGGSVGFIGAYERERAESILYLAKQGFAVRVWGQGWNKKSWLSHPNIKTENMPLWGDDYAKAICSFDINLHFLRKINRDQQTTRSIEIPMSGGLMLTTHNKHLSDYFELDRDIFTFKNKEECLSQIRRLLSDDALCDKARKSARERALKEHTWEHRAMSLLEVVGFL